MIECFRFLVAVYCYRPGIPDDDDVRLRLVQTRPALPVLKGSGSWFIFGISADSQRFLVALPTEPSEQSQINVVMGWFEELKQLAPTN